MSQTITAKNEEQENTSKTWQEIVMAYTKEMFETDEYKFYLRLSAEDWARRNWSM